MTRIDAATDAVSDTVRVGGSPVAVAAGLGAIWVADAGTDAVIRIDPRTRKVEPPDRASEARRPRSRSPAARCGRRRPRRAQATAAGRCGSHPCAVCDSIDPASYDGNTWTALSPVYDGLVAYRRVPGVGGSTLVADLAASVPQPADGGRSYTFQLRPGCGSPTARR